jgi:hypothetical protein
VLGTSSPIPSPLQPWGSSKVAPGVLDLHPGAVWKAPGSLPVSACPEYRNSGRKWHIFPPHFPPGPPGTPPLYFVPNNLNYFIDLHSSHCPPFDPLSHSSSSLSYSLPLRGYSLPTRPPPSLGPQVSPELSPSSPTKARPGRSLLHTCKRLRTSLCTFLVGGSVSGSSLVSELGKTTSLPMGLLSLAASSILPLIQHYESQLESNGCV